MKVNNPVEVYNKIKLEKFDNYCKAVNERLLERIKHQRMKLFKSVGMLEY